MRKYIMIEHDPKYGTYVWFADESYRGYKTVTVDDLDEECCIADYSDKVKIKIDLTKIDK